MSLYQVKHRLRINNEVHPAGKNISLTDEQAQPLLKAGVVVKLLEPVSPSVSAIEMATPVTNNPPTVQVGLPSAVAPQPVDTTLATALVNAAAPTATPEKVAEPIAETVATPEISPTSTTEPVAQISSTDLPSNDNNAYGKLTKAELNTELDKRGITHDAKAINADLEALLVADDSKKAEITANPSVETLAK